MRRTTADRVGHPCPGAVALGLGLCLTLWVDTADNSAAAQPNRSPTAEKSVLVGSLGRAYLAQMYRRYGSWPDAVAAYNWGPGRMDSWISGGRPFDKFPLAVEIYRIRVLAGSSLGMSKRGFVHLQPRRPAADPHNGRAAVERLYAEIMRASELGIR